MTAPVSRPAARSGTLGSLWWLPPGGFGNGLDDDAWAPVLTISERVVPRALSLLRQVYLGVHWPGDVVAGWLFAECWLRLTRELNVEARGRAALPSP